MTKKQKNPVFVVINNKIEANFGKARLPSRELKIGAANGNYIRCAHCQSVR